MILSWSLSLSPQEEEKEEEKRANGQKSEGEWQQRYFRQPRLYTSLYSIPSQKTFQTLFLCCTRPSFRTRVNLQTLDRRP